MPCFWTWDSPREQNCPRAVVTAPPVSTRAGEPFPAAVRVGNAVGSGDWHGAQRAGWIAVAMSGALMLVAGLLMLTLIGIPLSYSIADGLALGFISYPIIKLLSGRGREVGWLTYLLALVLLLGVSQAQRVLNREREQLGLTRVAPLENAPPSLSARATTLTPEVL